VAKPRNLNVLNIISKEFFQVALLTYLILALLESIQTGIISYFFNMNYLLSFVLLTGVLMVITETVGRVRNISKKTSRVVIGLAIKSAIQAKQARLAAQHQAAVAKSEAVYRSQQVRHVTAVQAHRVAPRTFPKPAPWPGVHVRKPVSMDGVVGTRPTTSLRPEPKRPIIRHNPRPPGGLVQ
jgi:hypothetical protein